MKSTAMITQQFRLQEWAEQIKDCNNRPRGMTVDEWCAQNGTVKATYYYRLKRVRKAYLETVPKKEIPTTVVPVSLTNSSVAITAAEISVVTPTNSIEITGKGFSLTVTNQTPLELLGQVLKAVGNA